jgi:AraC-like DNA-binding protein
MTLIPFLDAMIRGGILVLLALWSWLLLRDHGAQLAARAAVAMNASIAAHVLGTMAPPIGATPLDPLFELGSVCVPALFWIFARTWFNDAARVGRDGWLAVLASMAAVLLVKASNEPRLAFYPVATVTLRAMMFAFALLGLWEAWRGRDGDLIEERRALRVRLVGAVGIFAILVNAIEIAIYQAIIPESARWLIELGILALTFGFCATMFSIAQLALFSPPQQSVGRAPTPPDEHDALAQRLRAYMVTTFAWRDEGLTIAALAAQLGEQEYRLRRAINGAMGHRNFAAFVNGYRLDEVRAALADPAQRDVPILTIALDAGFGSLGPFNRAFREAEGMTPSEFRAARLADSGIG